MSRDQAATYAIVVLKEREAEDPVPRRVALHDSADTSLTERVDPTEIQVGFVDLEHSVCADEGDRGSDACLARVGPVSPGSIVRCIRHTAVSRSVSARGAEYTGERNHARVPESVDLSFWAGDQSAARVDDGGADAIGVGLGLARVDGSDVQLPVPARI